MYLSLLDLLRQAGSLAGSGGGFGPAMELEDAGDYLVLRAALAGVDPRSVQIGVSETGLTIGGHSTREEQTEGPEFFQFQSSVSSFFREVPFQTRVIPNRSAARWEGHILVITLPKQ